MNYGYILNIIKKTRLKIPISLDLDTFCHTLITGSSGSGKSYALLYLLGILLKCHPDIIIFFCDFKNSSDFAFLKNYAHYYAGNDCYKGVMNYYSMFSEARRTRDSSKRYILIFDEYPSFVNYLQMNDKINRTKFANDILSVISEILMLGRGMRFFTWIITQRADSCLFNNGSRDNFMIIIGLGQMSREQRNMLFSGEDIPDRIYKKGEGILLADGHSLTEVKFPLIVDVDDWKRHILEILNRDCV